MSEDRDEHPASAGFVLFAWLLALAACSALAGCSSADQGSLEAGRRHVAAKEWALAVGHLDEAVRIAPDSAESFALRGEAQLRLKRLDAAASDLEKACRLDPRATGTRLLLAECRLEMGEEAKAVAACDEALQLDEKIGAALVLRGRAHLAEQRYGEADKDFDAVLNAGEADTSGRSAAAFMYRGIARIHLGELESAEKDLSEAIELDGRNAQAYWYRAAVRAKLDRPLEAKADLARARELDPSLALADSTSAQSLLQGLRGRSSAEELDPRLK